MRSSVYDEVIVEENDVFQALYNGANINLADCRFENTDSILKFNQAIVDNADNIPQLTEFEQTALTQQQFDQNNQARWFMPEEYKNFNMVEFLLDKTTNETEYQRVVTELELFYQHNMMDVLNYLKYLVDTMRTNNIVWGAGRGSSVASYCLYLLGVHKVNSIKYELDIREFLK
jgi:DNA polymerase III alpha subunit